MASFYIPLTGLDADSTALNTIANNLANMNTTGYKAQTTSFSDLLYQQIGTSGSGDTVQVGSGVQVASNSTDFSGGSISSTGISTDAAINGTGFFVLDNQGSQLYTRNGSFQTGPGGVLETSGGLPLMGYGVTKGVVNTSGSLTDITIPTGQVMKPSATTTFSLTQNIDSTAAVGDRASGQVKVYDSLGNSYEATVTYTKTGNNAWSYSISMPDNLTPTSSTTGGSTTISYNFGSSGGTQGRLGLLHRERSSNTSVARFCARPLSRRCNLLPRRTISTSMASTRNVMQNASHRYQRSEFGFTANTSLPLSIRPLGHLAQRSALRVLHPPLAAHPARGEYRMQAAFRCPVVARRQSEHRPLGSKYTLRVAAGAVLIGRCVVISTMPPRSR